MRGRTPTTALLAVATLLGAACTGVGPLAPSEEGVEVILIPEDPVLTAIGARTRVELRLGDGVTPSGVTWRSSAPSVATVDGEGVVTAVSDGVTTITAQVGAFSAGTTITVAATIANVVRVRSNLTDSNSGNDVITVNLTVMAN